MHINTIYIKLRKKKSDYIKKKMFAKKKKLMLIHFNLTRRDTQKFENKKGRNDPNEL